MILPTRRREEQARRCVAEFQRTAPELRIVVVTEDEIDPIAGTDGIYSDDGLSAVEKWNLGLEWMNDGDAFMLGADDLWPHDGWYEAAQKALDTHGFVGINDGRCIGTGFAPHFILRRDWLIKHNGGVLAIPHYRSWYIDTETAARAHRAREFHIEPACFVEHRHMVWDLAPDDDTYKRGRAWQEQDRETFSRRQREGFPDDFEAVLR